MANTPKVAVITRTKDRALLLERALQSIHKQTMTDFVHVIFNDGGEPEPVEKLVKKYKDLVKDRIHLIHKAQSKGMEDAILSEAVRSVSSTYVAIHDDDDSWHPEYLERTVAVLEEQQAAGVVVKTDKVIEEIDAANRQVVRLKTEAWMPELKAVNLYRQCIDNQMTPITFLYRRSVFDELDGYDDSLAVCGDWDFGIRFLQKYDVEFLDPGFALAYYHHRAYKPGGVGNTSAAGNDRHRYYTNLLMNKYLRQELAEGRLGVGYIMSKLRYEQSAMAVLAQRVLPGFVAKRLKRRVVR